jgi:hypothetical protein
MRLSGKREVAWMKLFDLALVAEAGKPVLRPSKGRALLALIMPFTY